MTFFMSDNIFISWSKSKSREFAFEVKNLLETLTLFELFFKNKYSTCSKHVHF